MDHDEVSRARYFFPLKMILTCLNSTQRVDHLDNGQGIMSYSISLLEAGPFFH